MNRETGRSWKDRHSFIRSFSLINILKSNTDRTYARHQPLGHHGQGVFIKENKFIINLRLSTTFFAVIILLQGGGVKQITVNERKQGKEVTQFGAEHSVSQYAAVRYKLN